MHYHLKNKHLSITVKDSGSELCSIFSENIEYLWQADPEYWNRHAPILFPIVGKLKENFYLHEGEKFELGQHGFARDKPFRLINQTEDTLIFEMHSDNASREIYPFEFLLQIGYQLTDKQIKISWVVKNEGHKPMYFSIGGHPGFNIPLSGDGSKNGYILDFGEKITADTYLLNKNGEVSFNTAPVLRNQQELIITEDLFSRGALIFKNTGISYVALADPNGNRLAGLHFEDYPYLGIWSPSDEAPFVCIEPWYGIADNERTNQILRDKEGIIELSPNGLFETSYSIEIY